MDLPIWADILLVFIAIWIVVVVVLVVVGRIVLARELALLLPNLIRLFGGLLRDARVPLRAKVVLAVASVWLASPIDLIPEFIPIIGSLDDAVVAALALRFVLGTTDGVVVREHWHGDPATLERLLRVALWGGAAVHRYLDGRLERVISLPVSQPTSCCFGGDGLDELYITSAWQGLSPQERRAQPLAGALFRVRPGVRGLSPAVDDGV